MDDNTLVGLLTLFDKTSFKKGCRFSAIWSSSHAEVVIHGT